MGALIGGTYCIGELTGTGGGDWDGDEHTVFDRVAMHTPLYVSPVFE